MESIQELGERIERIENRNKLVETNKAWETSITRRVVLFILTYLAIGIYLGAIDVSRPWLNAVVPSIGFMLSTLSLPLFKALWQRYIFKSK